MGAAFATQQYEDISLTGERPRHELQEEAMLLVRIGDGRIHEHSSPSEPVPIPKCRCILHRPLGRFESVRDDQDMIRLDRESLNDRLPDKLAGNRDRRRGANRSRNHPLEVASPGE